MDGSSEEIVSSFDAEEPQVEDHIGISDPGLGVVQFSEAEIKDFEKNVTPLEESLLASDKGIVGLDLSAETLEFFGLLNLQSKHNKWSWVSLKRVNLHIYMYDSASEFAPFKDKLKFYLDSTLLIGLDVNRVTGHSHYLCTTLEARNNLLNPPPKKKGAPGGVDKKKKEEEESWIKLASIIPRQWKGLGSELEVDEENVKVARPLATLEGHREKGLFRRECHFEDAIWEGSTVLIESFEPEEGVEVEDEVGVGPEDVKKVPQMFPLLEIDRGIQVNPPKVSSSTQTPFAYKRNKITQHEIQSLDPKEVDRLLNDPSLTDFLNSVLGRMERALQQNEMVNLTSDDYNELGGEVSEGDEDFHEPDESTILGEYLAKWGAQKQKALQDPEEVSGSVSMGHLKPKSLLKSNQKVQKEEVALDKELGKEYQEFLQFQRDILVNLKGTEPEMRLEGVDLDKEFEELIQQAEKRL